MHMNEHAPINLKNAVLRDIMFVFKPRIGGNKGRLSELQAHKIIYQVLHLSSLRPVIRIAE